MKITKLNIRRTLHASGALLFILINLISFQNCSQVSFSAVPAGISTSSSTTASSSLSLSIQKFTTPEDTPLNAQPITFSSLSLKKSIFTITKQPSHGSVTAFDSANARFTYIPSTKFFGEDSFEYKEKEDGLMEPHVVPVSITIVMNDEAPVITTDFIGFEMNKADSLFTLQLTDYNDPNPKAFLTADNSAVEMPTKNGVLKQIAANKFSYTPKVNYRGTDQYEFWAINAYGRIGKKIIELKVENPFSNLEPSMAVRGMGCVTCHMKSTSSVITDFGAGDNAFFGKNALSVGANPFLAPYSFYNDHAGVSFLSATLNKILIPDVKLPFDLKIYDILSEAEKATTTVPQYVNAVRGSATVIVKSQIYIGAPNVNTILNRTNLGQKTFDYSKNQDSSPTLSGLINKGFYFESSSLICDGDLSINGSLYLNNLSLQTNTGCRIYATGPIFINGKITYTQVIANPINNTNLQLVSAVWINLGVGSTHCESAPDYPVADGWYKVNQGRTPFNMRMREYTSWTRDGLQNPDALAKIQDSIVGFSDASCRKASAGELPRQVHFERILLNAPRIDSRYTGQFDGVIISEVAMMSLSAFSFSFDPVFSRVPILPLLLPSDYLVVK